MRKGIVVIGSGGLEVVGNGWVSVPVAVAQPDDEMTAVSLW